MPNSSIILVGTGQSMRSDDAVGLIAVQNWQEAFPETAKLITVEAIENPGLNLLGFISGFQNAIIVDGVVSGKLPGTIHRLNEMQLAIFSSESKSVHGWGVAETLALGRSLYSEKMPAHIVLIGIEIQSVDIGGQLSSAILAALPEFISAIQAEINYLLQPRDGMV